MAETMMAAGPGRGGRMSRQRQRDAVLRLLRGEDLEVVSRALGVTAATLGGWRDAFLSAGEASLARRPADGEALEHERLKARLGEMLLERELLEAKVATLEGGRPLSPPASPCATTTAANTCPQPSRASCASWASPARPPSCGLPSRAGPGGNGCAERFIRTPKENLPWVRHCATVEELRQAVLTFRDTDNTTWPIGRHGFQTPAAIRQQQLQPAAIAA